MREKVAASSLVEITVAAIILVLVFTLSLAVCARLVHYGPSQRQVKYQQVVQQAAAATIRTHSWHSRTTQVGTITLEQEVHPYRGNRHLLQLRVQAIERDKVMASCQQLVYSPSPYAP
ncbi:hypothetical protein J0X19_24450 [Hymenobacter sp. BT186]|uniref:Uncharacterized protein n=1 Tax=Hymenobacter telluris TaxID=2816474 RepID=A0A939F2H1_9BACT|nr:hypothetical protein [Hymenobacter telluris]MBO0361132.1 hypothetical protein [Hymenobacter telluris]MBW3377160.1 hypothetical protein [Hymenobacter norwichensis]